MFSFEAYVVFWLRRKDTTWTVCFRHAVQAAVTNQNVEANTRGLRPVLDEDYFRTICDACAEEEKTGRPWNPLEG